MSQTNGAPPRTEPTYDPALLECPLCGGCELLPFDRDCLGHTIDRCGQCGVKLMNPQYTDAWLQDFYSSYVSLDGQHDGRWRAQPEVRRAGKHRALQLMAQKGTKGRILMVGCGDGLELEVARELGWTPEGHDVDPATTARVATDTGIAVHCGCFTRIAVPAESFDAVFLDQVIEHPKNPGDFLRTARRLLRPGGILYLGLPNIGSLANATKTVLGRIGLRGSRRGRHYASRHHIFYYEPRVLTRLLRRDYGFEVVCVRGSPKPARNPMFRRLVERMPFLDSSFVVLARRPRQ